MKNLNVGVIGLELVSNIIGYLNQNILNPSVFLIKIIKSNWNTKKIPNKKVYQVI